MIPAKVARWNMAAIDLDAEEVAIAAGIPLESRSSFSYEEGVRLWEVAETLTGDPTIGHRAGAQQHVSDLGALGSLFAHAADVRSALEGLSRVGPALVPGSRVVLVPEGRWTELRYSRPPSPRSTRHGVESLAAGLVAMIRHCTRQNFSLVRVALDNPRPADTEPYTRFYGVEVEWDAECMILELPLAVLELRLTSADAVVHELLSERIDQLLPQAMSMSSRMSRIRRAVSMAVHMGDPSLEGAARELGVSGRTLQRQLRSEGVTFRDLRSDALRRRAEELLAANVPVEQVAEALGYSTRSGFERAFRSWTGETPRSFKGG
jgi:AraC-like DNA-binding protein